MHLKQRIVSMETFRSTAKWVKKRPISWLDRDSGWLLLWNKIKDLIQYKYDFIVRIL